MGGRFSDLSSRIFLGKKIKLIVPAINPNNGNQTKEHMWVKVSYQNSSDNYQSSELTGIVLENPKNITNFELGDTVTFAVSEIADIYPEGVC